MRLLSTIPIFVSTDLLRTQAFYHQVGFATHTLYPDYLTLHRDGVELHVQLRKPADLHPRTLYMRVEKVDAWFLAMKQQLDERHFLSAPTDQFYGIREFSLHDPDGNVLHIGEYLVKPQ
jgi:hypothetical protein